MKIARFVLCTILIILLAGATAVTAPPTQENLPQGLANAKSKNPKIESKLEQILEQYSTNPITTTSFAEKHGIKIQNNTVRVIMELLYPEQSSIKAIEKTGAKIEASEKNLVQATVPLSELQKISALPFIRYVRLPLKPHLLTESQGVSAINASQLHSPGIRGSGVKVAILDLGFDGYVSKLGYELPANVNVTVKSFRADGDINGTGPDRTDHGTACAEIVHDVAPDAQLYLANFDTEVNYSKAVEWLISENVDVISFSIGWVNAGPYDGTGYICDVVNNASEHGIFWAGSAGNSAQKHWEGNFSDSDGDGWHNFLVADETQNIIAISGTPIQVFLSWDDWPDSNQDFDLYLLDNNLDIIAQSESPQTGTQEPIEAISYYVPTGIYHIAILNYSATRNVHFELYSYTYGFQYNEPNSSLLIPADANGSFTVGATYWVDDSLEPFSSRGPTNDNRTKPDATAPDGVSNSIYGSSSGSWSVDYYSDVSFFGTSASAPHAAGAAALLLSANSSLNVSQLRYFLEIGAKDLGADGKDNLYGSGRIDAYQSYLIATPPASVTNLSNTTGNFWINWSWTNPSDPDFNHTMFFVNGTLVLNTSSNYYNLTNLTPHNTSVISTKTVDIYGNINSSSVDQTTQIPNNPIQITNVSSSYTIAEGQPLYINANYTDADNDTGTFADNSTKWNVNSATGVVTWNTTDGDQGVYVWYINVSDGYDSNSTQFTVTVIDSTPTNATNLQNTTGNFWINWTWNAGNNADDYDVWINGSDRGHTANRSYYENCSPHATRISLRSHNHTLNSSSNWTNQTTTIPNNNITIIDVPATRTINENEILFIDANATDLDGDTPVFSCNNTSLFNDFNTTTGKGNFTPTYAQSGSYAVDFGVSDEYGSISNRTMTITVVNIPLLVTSYWNNKTGGNLATACWQNETIQFGVTANRAVNTAWYYDGILKQNNSFLNYTWQFTVGGVHYVNVSAYYQVDKTDNTTFTVSVPLITVNEMRTNDYVQANNSTTFTYNNTIVKSISIIARSNLANVSIEVQDLANVSSSLFNGTLSGTPYAYCNIIATNLTDANLSSLNVTFTVNKSWLEQSGLDPGNVRLNRYNNNSREVYSAAKIGETSDNITYRAENVQGLSVFAITAFSLPAPTPTPPGDGGGSGGGGGGASPGEPYENIADTEVQYILAITPNKQNSVAFRKSTHHILEVGFAYSQVADEVSVTLEKLINSSLLASGVPPGVVFENVNIWVNVPNPGYVSNASIKFCVEKSWLSKHSIDSNSIALYRFKDGAWSKLSTSRLSENETLIFYLASATGFSPFAIAGEKIAITAEPTNLLSPAPTQTQSYNQTPAPTGTLEITPTQKPIPGFELMAAAIGVIMALRLSVRKE